MATKLPKMEGEQPVAGRLKINGLSSTLDVANKRGKKIWILVEAEVNDIALHSEKVGPVRVETAQIIRHCPMDEHEAVAKLNEEDERRADEAEALNPRLAIED